MSTVRFVCSTNDCADFNLSPNIPCAFSFCCVNDCVNDCADFNLSPNMPCAFSFCCVNDCVNDCADFNLDPNIPCAFSFCCVNDCADFANELSCNFAFAVSFIVFSRLVPVADCPNFAFAPSFKAAISFVFDIPLLVGALFDGIIPFAFSSNGCV